jgi:hypothetical protein
MAHRATAAMMVMMTLGGCAAGQGWTARNTALELAFVGETAVDTYQTARNILPNCAELNPIVGRCGDRVPLAIYIPAGLLLHAAVAWALPPRWRTPFQAISLGFESIAVGSNVITQRIREDREHDAARIMPPP